MATIPKFIIALNARHMLARGGLAHLPSNIEISEDTVLLLEKWILLNRFLNTVLGQENITGWGFRRN